MDLWYPGGMIEKQELLQLLEVPLFKGLDPVEARDALARVSVERRSWEEGSQAFSRGDPCIHLHFLIRGRLSAEMSYPDGKLFRVEYLRAPDSVAALIPFAQDNSFPVSLWAERSSLALAISRADFLQLLQELPPLAERLLQEGGDKIVFLGEKLRLTHLSSLREKLAAHLLGLAEKQRGEPLRMGYTKTDLAELLGVTRPALSRCFSALEKEGFFHEEGQALVLDDPQAMQEILKGE